MIDDNDANWPKIVAIALKADADLGKCNKPGQRMRFIYLDSYRDACALGYPGDEDDWQSFIRVRARAHYGRG